MKNLSRLGVLAMVALRSAAQQPDLILADFEGSDYGQWRTTGDAFGPGPARGTLPGQQHVDGFLGKGLVNTFLNGDRSIGTLTSPEFKIERKFISFLIGGGGFVGKTCVNLWVDGQIVRSAAGPNTNPGGSETLAPATWDVDEFAGRNAHIQIVDDATDGWGHINVDQIIQTDRKTTPAVGPAQREFTVEKHYLNIPIKNGAPKRKVAVWVEGQELVANDIELANGEPDWWSSMDVGVWHGRKLSLRVDRLSEDSKALSQVTQSDTMPGSEPVYHERLRGQFHFSPRRGWNNDPNGLVYYRDEYHLFFQHNPYGWGWGNMHWGHATSRDLIHWQELGEVLYPDHFGPMFSGSAVVDWNNSSGLGKPGQPAQVLIYTAAGNPTVQCLASSTDGRSYTKYRGNPVVREITEGNRDPKVIWHEPSKKWVMVLYVETNKVHTIHFLHSTNLKDWALVSQTEGFFECPDFFELPVDGNSTNRKWILTAASSDYMVGTFDGTKFSPETPRLKGHLGRGFYAAQTFSDIPESDGRRIQIGWFQTETRGMPFNQSMTIPLELKLKTLPEGPRLTRQPVNELKTLRGRNSRRTSFSLAPGEANPMADIHGELLEVRADFDPGRGPESSFVVRGIPVRYNSITQELTVDGMTNSAPPIQGHQRLVIYADRTSLEVFASDGLVYMPVPVIPKPEDQSAEISVSNGTVRFHSLEAYELIPIWK